MRILLLALTLTACSCSSEQIAPDAQQRLANIASAYSVAHAVELSHCSVPSKPCEEVRRAGYVAEGAYVTADSQRTSQAIATAMEAVLAFSAACRRLQ